MSNNLMSLLGLITDERIIEENLEFNMTTLNLMWQNFIFVYIKLK